MVLLLNYLMKLTLIENSPNAMYKLSGTWSKLGIVIIF